MTALLKNKNSTITAIFILLCFGVYKYFPAVGTFQEMIATLIFFVAIPLLYDKVILRRKRGLYRLQAGDWRKGLFWMAIGVFLALCVAGILVKFSTLLNNYSLPVGLGKSFGYFVFYELVLVAFFTAVYEFFFRGFVLFHFAPDLKYWAIVVQYGLFLLLLLVTGSSFWALAPYIIFAPFAGWIAYKSDSLAYSFFGQLIFIIIIDTYIVVSLAK